MYPAFVGAGDPGQDGMRRARFPINYAVSKDFCRFQVLGAPGSIVLPFHDSQANLAERDPGSASFYLCIKEGRSIAPARMAALPA
jgi:hypothetical protein